MIGNLRIDLFLSSIMKKTTTRGTCGAVCGVVRVIVGCTKHAKLKKRREWRCKRQRRGAESPR